MFKKKKSPLFIHRHTQEYEILVLLKPGACLHLYLALVHKICLLTFNTQAAGLQQLTGVKAWSCLVPDITLYLHCSTSYPLPQLQITCGPKNMPSIRSTIPQYIHPNPPLLPFLCGILSPLPHRWLLSRTEWAKGQARTMGRNNLTFLRGQGRIPPTLCDRGLTSLCIVIIDNNQPASNYQFNSERLTLLSLSYEITPPQIFASLH